MKKLIKKVWLMVWGRRLAPGEHVVEITGWRSAIIQNDYTTQRVTFALRPYSDNLKPVDVTPGKSISKILLDERR